MKTQGQCRRPPCQRCCMRCLLIQNCKAGVVFPVCRHAAGLGITLVTITQRAALLKYHAVELRLIDGEGDWQLRTIVPGDG